MGFYFEKITNCKGVKTVLRSIFGLRQILEVNYLGYCILNYVGYTGHLILLWLYGVSELFKILCDEEICGFDRSALYRIPFNLDSRHQTLAGLSHILYYQTVPLLTKGLAGNCFIIAFRECLLVSYFHMIIQKLGIFNSYRPNYGFSFRTLL